MKNIIIIGARGVGKKALVEAMQKLENQNFTVAQVVDLQEQISNQSNDFNQLLNDILKDSKKIHIQQQTQQFYPIGLHYKGGKGQRARNRSSFKNKFNKQSKNK